MHKVKSVNTVLAELSPAREREGVSIPLPLHPGMAPQWNSIADRMTDHLQIEKARLEVQFGM